MACTSAAGLTGSHRARRLPRGTSRSADRRCKRGRAQAGRGSGREGTSPRGWSGCGRREGARRGMGHRPLRAPRHGTAAPRALAVHVSPTRYYRHGVACVPSHCPPLRGMGPTWSALLSARTRYTLEEHVCSWHTSLRRRPRA
eukprot:scaffold3898_cov401-Prasinococcus_capsulatus_cf.AAC.10